MDQNPRHSRAKREGMHIAVVALVAVVALTVAIALVAGWSR